jgi:polar amino acid transport system substrate-binding protein
MRLVPWSLVTLLAIGLFGVPAAAQTDKDALAPTGTLRAVFLGGNPVQGRVDQATGAITGPVPDLVRELARTIGAPVVILQAADAAGVISALKEGRADIGFLAFDETRAREVDFGAPFLIMANSYLVTSGSRLQTSADVDRTGITVAAVRGQTQQLFVSSRLKSARIQLFDTMPPQPEVERLLTSGAVDAFAINRQRSLEAQAASGGTLRALADSFLDVEQCFVVARGNGAGVQAIERFVDRMRQSGFIQLSIERAGLTGVRVATGGRR